MDSESPFNPHHKWLGIPPNEQPANHYRLLGVQLFETDAEVIERAADRQMAYLEKLRDGPQGEFARRLLSEIAAARVCLLEPARRRAYDAGLRDGRRLDASHAVAPSRPPVEACLIPPTIGSPGPPIAPAAAPAAATGADAREAPSIAPVVTPAEPTRSPQPKPEFVSAVEFPAAACRGPRAKARSRPEPRRRLIVIVALSLFGLGTAIGLAVVSSHSLEPLQPVSSPVRDRGSTVTAASVPVAPATSQPLAAAADTLTETTAADAATQPALPAEERNESPAETSAAASVQLPSALAVLPEVSDVQSPATQPTDDASPPPDAEPRAAMAAAGSTPAESAPTAEPRHDGDSPAAAHGVQREVWLKAPGNKIEDLLAEIARRPAADQREVIARLEAPEDFGDNYGQRLRGWLVPPQTGEYRFRVKANAAATISLSLDDDPANARVIEADVPVMLSTRQVYFIEVLHKESTGRDFVSIGWRLPDGNEELPIAGERLQAAHTILPAHARQFVLVTIDSISSNAPLAYEIDSAQTALAKSNDSTPAQTMLVVAAPFRPTALRLECLPGERLPGGGPGTATGGRFSLSEVTAEVLTGAGPDAPGRPLGFLQAVGPDDLDLRRLIDGNEKSAWSHRGRGETAAVVLILDPASLPPDAPVRLRLTLDQREPIGKLRVAATSAANPLRLGQAPATAADVARFRLFVNVGGEDVVDESGQRWQASKGFDQATFGHEGGNAAEQPDARDRLAATAQRGIQAFRAVVPPGHYDVALYFCEYWASDPQRRVFSIVVEGRVVVRDLILQRAAGGFAAPWTLPIPNVPVADGRLDIEFHPAHASSSAILNAVRIEQRK